MSKKRVIDVPQLKFLVEDMALTQKQVSVVTGIPRKKVTKFCRRYGIKSQRTGPRSGAGHPEWKGGRILVKGYWMIYAPDHPNCTKKNRVAEHRLVMEKKLGRYLTRKEVVHHLDGNSQNNAPDNLHMFASNGEHLRAELIGRVPNWSPEGYQRILEAAQRKSNRAKLKRDGGLPAQE